MTRARTLPDKATPRGRFPHVRLAGGFAYVSGTSARRPDNTIAGADVDPLGTATLDIRAQTRAVIENIQDILRAVGAELDELPQRVTRGIKLALTASGKVRIVLSVKVHGHTVRIARTVSIS